MTIDATTWLYVAIQKEGSAEQIVGQNDAELSIAYIPAFLDKETAQQSLFQLKLEKKKKVEVQAIIYEDLARHAAENGFLIFILNADGMVLERLPAAPQTS